MSNPDTLDAIAREMRDDSSPGLLIDSLILEDLQRKWADRVRYMRKAPAKSALQTRRDAIRECIADLDEILKGEPK